MRNTKALKRMALFATALTLAGHIFLGFEQSWMQVIVTVLMAYVLELTLETFDARVNQREPRYAGGFARLFEFLLSGHLTGISVALLLYTQHRYAPLLFAVAVGIGSKWLFRVPLGNGTRHLFNPSNFGIVAALLLVRTIGIAPPYQFTANVAGVLDWVIPAILVLIGVLLNAQLTLRIPLILGWLGGFLLQAGVRSLFFDVQFVAALMPVSGMAFLLYTLYMITDPATTPHETRPQIAFGLGVAAVYGVLQVLHVVYGLFFALIVVCGVRGLYLYLAPKLRQSEPAPLPAKASAGGAHA